MIHIDTVYCKGCGLCMAACNTNALTFGKERNQKGYLTPVADDALCVKCKNCEMICPDMAIWVDAKEEAANA